MNVRTSTRFRRERNAVPSARAFVKHTLRSAAAPVEATERLVLAVAEACNNAVLHAGGRTFTVSVTVDDGHAVVVIADHGQGFEPPVHLSMPGPYATGQRGLALMRALVDDVEVVSDDDGTSVVLGQSVLPMASGAPLVVEGGASTVP